MQNHQSTKDIIYKNNFKESTTHSEKDQSKKMYKSRKAEIKEMKANSTTKGHVRIKNCSGPIKHMSNTNQGLLKGNRYNIREGTTKIGSHKVDRRNYPHENNNNRQKFRNTNITHL